MRDLHFVHLRELMMRGFFLTLAVILAFTSSALADTAIRIQDPEKFSNDIFGTPPRVDPAAMAKTIATTIGKPSLVDTVEKALKVLEGKKVDILKKVRDEDFGGALRQIIYYTYMEDFGFIYFRFDYKLTSTGWILSNFKFKNETEEIFPKDFLIQ
jgi:hypothetical protein